MTSPLQQRLNEAVKTAMKAGDKPRVGALRLITAAMKQKEVDERIQLDDAAVIGILQKLAKQRRESIAQYRQAKRDDLVAQEEFELTLINEFLPAPLSQAELDAMIDGIIANAGASSVRDMGKIMAELKAKVAGRADMSQLSAQVRSRLSG